MTTPTERDLPITLDLPSSLYREIGRVMAAHAAVEWVLNRIVFQLLRLKPVEGRIAVREPRTTDRLDMITDLLEINKIKVKLDTKTLNVALEQAYRERDQLAHGVWYREAGKRFPRLSSGKWQPPEMNKAVKRRIDLEAQEYTSMEAKETCRLIVGVLSSLGELEDEIVAALAASPEKSPSPYPKRSPRRGRASKKRPTPRGSSPR